MNTVPLPVSVAEAHEVAQDLNDALVAAGVTLPSLGIDLPSCVPSFLSEARPLVDLGRCNLETARRLADVLRGADS